MNQFILKIDEILFGDGKQLAVMFQYYDWIQ